MKFGEIPVAEAEGAILAHSIRQGAVSFKKGRVLSAADVARLQDEGVTTVFAARLDAEDIHEDEAARRISRAIASEGVQVQAPFTGRANLYAPAAGIALIDAGRVRALNRLHESLTLATVQPFDIVSARQMLATAKIIPFAAPRAIVEEALALAAGPPMVSLAPFRPHRAGLVITDLPGTKKSLRDKTVAAIGGRLAALGSTLGEVIDCPHAIAPVVAAIRKLKASGHRPVLVFGASAIVDRGDVIPAAVVEAGGEVIHLGMPVDPGNLMMLGRLGDAPVIGVPSCARSPKLNGFDWVLARILAGIDVRPQDIMDMGAGGLLMEIPTRPLPRETRPQGAPRAPRIAAVVLAAGTSSRMQGANKLLQPVAGKPMVRHAVEAALASPAAPVIVVTGHEAVKVEAALSGLQVETVRNADFAKGQASSLKAGIAALPGDVDGAVILLGDMPLVSSGTIGRLIAAFNPGEGRAICVPVHQGRRGNPVLWAKRFFAEIAKLEGDEGAHRLIAAHAEEVSEVEVESDAIFRDFDTPESLERL